MTNNQTPGFISITVEPDGKFSMNSNIEDKYLLTDILLDLAKSVVKSLKEETSVAS